MTAASATRVAGGHHCWAGGHGGVSATGAAGGGGRCHRLVAAASRVGAGVGGQRGSGGAMISGDGAGAGSPRNARPEALTDVAGRCVDRNARGRSAGVRVGTHAGVGKPPHPPLG